LAYEVLKRLDMVSEFLPDLILKDIELTDTDGFEICSRLKPENLFKEISVVFITAYTESTNAVKGFFLSAYTIASKFLSPFILFIPPILLFARN
jgi:CheY-like chemotaxis protein